MTPHNRKILIIVENESVPFDSRVWKEAQALREHGYKVSVLCPTGRGATKFYELLSGIHIYRHPAAVGGGGKLGYMLEFAWALICEFLFAWWIYLRRGFQVVQGCNPPDDIFLVALPFKLLGVKYIFDHHDVNPELYVAKYGRKDLMYCCQVALEKLTYRFSDVVIATNESYKELAVSRGGHSPDDVFVVRNGPDLSTFGAVAPKEALKHGKEHLVGYVGTMNAQDGLDLLLEVAARIKATGRRDVHFTCVGGGPSLPTLREMAKEKGLSEMVNFTGRISDEALLDVLSTSDVCVNPDRPCEINNISTMIKIMEYMALGKPIVQFESKEGRFSAQSASLYAAGEDPIGDFAAKLLHLLDHADERERMGQFGRKRVQEELAWEYSVRHLLDAYDRAFLGQRCSLPLRGFTARAKSFYTVKPLIPRGFQVSLRRRMAECILRAERDHWPIWELEGSAPPAWPGWPGGKRFALVLSHDVESHVGVLRCLQLADLEQNRGFNSSFGFVPLRYQTPEPLRQALVDRGFEVMVHDLYHDGKLYRSRRVFDRRSAKINQFLHQWQSRGFTSGSMHHNLPWIADLDIDYDLSTFDVDPFEPQTCGLGRIFPCWVHSPDNRPGFVELPYTMPQDFTLFVLLRERTNEIWRRKLDWIVERGGMVLVKTHSDYMAFDSRGDRQYYPVELYTDFLDYVNERYRGDFWLAHPSHVARYWRSLQDPPSNRGAGIPWRETFCPSCRQAHAAGWLTDYPVNTETLKARPGGLVTPVTHDLGL